LKLSHYSEFPVTEIRSVSQETVHDMAHFEKPKGFWVSVDGPGDWKDYCEQVHWLAKLTFRYRVTLAGNANILTLRSPEDIDSFTDRYGIVPAPVLIPTGFGAGEMHQSPPTIDWARVAREYQGIIIAPYIWQKRLDYMAAWYYGWDCACGCIWDASAIAKLRLMTVHKRKVAASKTNSPAQTEQHALKGSTGRSTG